jgi:hypothetical protein
MKRSSAAILALAAVAAPAAAQVALSNVVHVEDRVSGARKAAAAAMRGDGLIYVFTYRNLGTDRIINYTINHPLVTTAEFVGGETGAPLMSVDKGVTFAPLAELRVRNPDGSERAALPRDVTHMRWRIPTIIEPGASGEVSYRARLR